ncbi:hypothetical protein [Streptomyces diastaticus]|uniref:hypothetical protein n=1 Tax=Streptomyces diastaticus TaxID=1956 RepID=UPI003D187428
MTTIPRATTYTLRIVRLATEKGLRPVWGQPYGHTTRIVLNAPGPHDAFGGITVGRTSGRVLRAEVIPYSGATPRRAEGAAAVRALLDSLPRAVCPADCPADSPADCR